jgi:hypothetical protein
MVKYEKMQENGKGFKQTRPWSFSHLFNFQNLSLNKWTHIGFQKHNKCICRMMEI